MDETWVDNTLCFSKCWQSEDMLGVLKNNSSSHRLIIVHAGGKNGFVNGADLIFKSGTTTGDYHGQMNAENFVKWIEEKLLPNIPHNSVIVMDNAPYHSVQQNKPPTKSNRKGDIIDWLNRNKIQCSEQMTKFELMHLVQTNKNAEKTYKIDELIKSHGHNVLRLPPYMCDLNPIELAWAQLKRKIRERNPSSTISKDDLQTFTREALSEITQNQWENFCRHVEKIEQEYWSNDRIIEDTEFNLGNSDSDDSDGSSSSSSSEDL
ncbi:uncharacterized protein LOC143367279 [Andrena cerasifolii]|uniref:uncharacterized protein LOC143367279 n=1 Tax=Andrena cerasifolii TaxID=2819439 RepID=UPI004037B301